MTLTHIVSAKEDGLTLENLLRGPLSLSARQSREAKKAGGITVDGLPFFSNQRVRAGQRVRVVLSSYAPPTAQSPQTADPDLQRESAPLPGVRVLYEDDALLAVYKPALLQCHPSPSAPGGSDTLEARVRAHLRASAHPVHRLDAETRGIVLFAKLPYAQAHLQRQMQDGRFTKSYRAWVFGSPNPPRGEIDAPIARLTPDSFTRVVRADGQRAVTRYAVLQTVRLSVGEASLVALEPLTGRTHQLRVHMAHIGHPLLGDARYGTPGSRSASLALGLSYHQLAAISLRFEHPMTGKTLRLDCAPEFDFDAP